MVLNERSTKSVNSATVIVAMWPPDRNCQNGTMAYEFALQIAVPGQDLC